MDMTCGKSSEREADIQRKVFLQQFKISTSNCRFNQLDNYVNRLVCAFTAKIPFKFNEDESKSNVQNLASRSSLHVFFVTLLQQQM